MLMVDKTLALILIEEYMKDIKPYSCVSSQILSVCIHSNQSCSHNCG